MHRHFLVWVSLILVRTPHQLFAQTAIDFKNYTPAKCQGDIPVALKNNTTAIVQENMKKIRNQKSDRLTKRQELEHSIRVGFLEEELLTGGQILYGEPMSEFVEKVGLKLLEGNEELKDKLQFYVLRSHVPNAYATSGGLVFVSIGLLARLENEAQLAVILAHEIQHYVQRHSFQTFKDVQQAKKDFEGQALDEKLSNLYRFSKEQEMEADDLGYKMISKTSYHLEEGIYGFEMLKYSAYPFLETPLSLDSFASEYYQFPKSIFEKILQEKETAEKANKTADEKELLGTNQSHPHLDMRILALRDRVGKLKDAGKDLYIIGKPEFEEMQKIARHELLLLFVRRADYGRAFYLTRVFELLYGQTPFISRVKANAIYALMIHKLSGHDLEKYGCETVSNRGQWRDISSAFKHLAAKDLSALTLRILWLEHVKYPDDEFIQRILDESLLIIQKKALLDIKGLAQYEPIVETEIPVNEPKGAVDAQKDLLSRPLRRTRNKENAVTSSEYFMSAIYGLPKHAILKEKINQAAIDYDAWLVNRDARKDVKNEAEKEKIRYQRKNSDYKGLVLMQPQFVQYDGKLYSDNVRNFFAEERSKLRMTEIWKNVAKTSNENLTILENKAKRNLKTTDINRYTQVNDWIMERLNNDSNQMILFYSQYVDEVMKDFGTPLVGWTGYEYTVYKRPLDLNGLFTSIMFFPYLPIYLYFQLQTDGITNQFTVVFNTETSRQVYKLKQNRTSKLKDDFLKAHVYETIYEIRHAKTLK